MSNPVLVEVTRGDRVESRHRGAVAVADADGRILVALGDIARPIYPRSAVKAIQALPMVEGGAADAFGFGARELALAQASHRGESAHVEGVLAMLTAIGLGETDLECGDQIPSSPSAAAELVRRGERPSQLHNNCSGKHANFLALARHMGFDHRGYVGAHHPVQGLVREALSEVTGVPLDAESCGVDGCSIPTYAIPLSALARGFARYGVGAGLSPGRAGAALRLREAALAEPFYISGSGGFDSEVMPLMQGRVQVKGGAEGVHCAVVAELGIGIALKCDDGSYRASDAMTAAILARFLPDYAEPLRRWSAAPVRSRRGAVVGEVRAVAEALAPR
jgi:L-asparaginase II